MQPDQFTGIPGGRKVYDRAAALSHEFVMQCHDTNELGDGLLFAFLFVGIYVHAKNSGQTYYFNEVCWRPDEQDTALAAVETVANLYALQLEVLGKKLAEATAAGKEGEALQLSIRERMGQIFKRVRRLRSDNGRRNCLKFAWTNPTLPLSIHGREFDKNPWLFACKNAVINLRTGEEEPARPEDFISKMTPVEWQGIDADATAWEETLATIYPANQDLIDYLQRLFGYGMTGLNVEHVFPVLHGRGRNGKSVLVEAIKHVAGEYAGTVPAEMLLDSGRNQSANQTSPDIALLRGLRFGFCSETDDGKKFSPARVKWLTGGDTLTCRGLYEKSFVEFEPTHLLVLLTNHRPTAPETDFAFWERCHVVPHTVSFVTREPQTANERRADKNLPRKLRECAPGILAWLVRGCLMWQKHGLRPPEAVTAATQEYQEEENYMARFVECCCVEDQLARTAAADLYAAFVLWYRGNVNAKHSFTPAQKGFSQKLMALERFARVKSNGFYFFRGIRLSAEWEDQVKAEAERD